MHLTKTQNNCYLDVETGEIVYQVKEVIINERTFYIAYAKDNPISVEYQHRGAAINYLKEFMAVNYGIKEEKNKGE